LKRTVNPGQPLDCKPTYLPAILLPKPCQNQLAPRPSATESHAGQAMHTEQSPCEDSGQFSNGSCGNVSRRYPDYAKLAHGLSRPGEGGWTSLGLGDDERP